MGQLMNIVELPIAGAFIVEGKPHSDHRGAFKRFYCEKVLAEVIGERRIVQINHSLTHSVGSVRGFHFQHAPYAEMKMVRCIRGRVWDVLVDLRAGSRTFLNWHAQELSPEKALMMVMPEGCAHGFQTLEPDSELLYLHTNFYTSQAEAGLRHDDPKLKIDWPLKVTDISERDKDHPLLTNDFVGLEI
jgi:dTDP-4-dehydrorhamnose 3,5-epimerase